jgi:hypothetical protein
VRVHVQVQAYLCECVHQIRPKNTYILSLNLSNFITAFFPHPKYKTISRLPSSGIYFCVVLSKSHFGGTCYIPLQWWRVNQARNEHEEGSTKSTTCCLLHDGFLLSLWLNHGYRSSVPLKYQLTKKYILSVRW